LIDKDKNGTFETASWDVKTDFDGDGKADWMEIVTIFKRYGFEWGGDWKFNDAPHFQKTFGKSINELAELHKNDKVDKLLEEARVALDKSSRILNYQEVQKIISEELPVIFLYEKNYTYLQSKKVKGFSGSAIIRPSDRFSGVASWYLKYKNKFSW